MDGLVYAYYVPKSSEQQRFIQERRSELAEQRKQVKEAKLSRDSTEYIERSVSDQKTKPGGADEGHQHQRDDTATSSYGVMEAARTRTSSSSGASSTHSLHAYQALLSNPYELRHGRRYLREVPYPLPCDLPEIQRQNLRTLLFCKVFGRAVCSPKVAKEAPRKVLEVGCGSGYWSASCHEYFCSLGHKKASFTGLDLAPLAPDWSKQGGLDWKFVQHDIRRIPLPFDDGEFDLVMLKDLSLVLTLGGPFQTFLDEVLRILGEGGTLEIWDSDHMLRSLLPHPPPPPSKRPLDQDIADQTATFLIAPGTPFAPAQSKYLQQANTWMQEALDRRQLPPSPCARIAQVLYQEPELLENVGVRRVAVPLGELRWERESGTEPLLSPKRKGKAGELTTEQYELRQTALMTVLQKIESLEPLLKDVSGKNSEEWSHWWASMMSALLDPSRGAITGECLEMGAWWATKLGGGIEAVATARCQD
ncbi:hypothetical protein B0A50_01425 [Salinomyces thailandicus]|uniref:Methyltransferase domain-containing protein n=1 Tax=Salinomyces thailandicus TaxID=706561 RepID=A0A4U0UAJ9_9PEZI|nr:hypothetical protein B0A50_01425 [Salinomyces thailandica]